MTRTRTTHRRNDPAAGPPHPNRPEVKADPERIANWRADTVPRPPRPRDGKGK